MSSHCCLFSLNLIDHLLNRPRGDGGVNPILFKDSFEGKGPASHFMKLTSGLLHRLWCVTKCNPT
jgi:hypothetical protein